MKPKIMLMASILVVTFLARWPSTIFNLRADDDEDILDKNQPFHSELDPEIVAEMTKAAERTYEATEAAYNAGTAVSTDLYVWSRRWLDAQRRRVRFRSTHLPGRTALPARTNLPRAACQAAGI